MANSIAERRESTLKKGRLGRDVVDEEQLDRCEAVHTEGRLERGERRAEVLERLQECEELQDKEERQ